MTLQKKNKKFSLKTVNCFSSLLSLEMPRNVLLKLDQLFIFDRLNTRLVFDQIERWQIFCKDILIVSEYFVALS